MKKKTIYYSNEENEDIINIKRKTIVIDNNYKYIKKNIFYKIGQFIIYNIFVKHFAFVYLKIKFHHKIINKKILKNYRKCGYFIYANHTLLAGDALIPSIINHPKTTKIIVHPDNISIKGTKTIIEMCGAIPIPSTLKAAKNFMSSVEYCIKKKYAVQIYPEKHVWPYYTKIRPFPSTSFKYPIKFSTPTFVFTNTYKKRRFSSIPQIITFVDGPFFTDKDLSPKEQERLLQTQIYNTMCQRSKNSTYSFYTYIKEKNSSD